MATAPQFAATPASAVAQVSTANTARDGTGTIVTVLTAGSNGTRIEEVVVKATSTTAAGSVVLFLHDGTNTRVFDEIPVTAITPSATVLSFSASRVYENLVIPNGWSLRAATTIANTFNVHAFAGNF